MISTFDLTLLGSLVSAGGLVFLRQGKWPYFGWSRLKRQQPADMELTPESRDRHERSSAMTGTRWLTVGVLTLFLAYTHGAEEGYLFGPWSDVMFHVIFVASCWGMTAFRMKQTALSVPATYSSLKPPAR